LRIQLRKTYLFAFLDDHSRLLPGYRWGYAEDTVRLAVALRPALASRGVPRAVYVQRLTVRRPVVAAGVRETRCAPGSFDAKSARRTWEDREVFQDRARSVPGRDHRRARRGGTPLRRRPHRVEPALHRLGRNRLSPYGAFGDRADAAGPLASRRPVSVAHPRDADRGVPVGGAPPGRQDRDRGATRQLLRGRPVPGRAESGAGVRPVRFDPHRGASGRRTDGAGHPAPHRAALAPEGQT
jgi:hypothetical protein